MTSCYACESWLGKRLRRGRRCRPYDEYFAGPEIISIFNQPIYQALGCSDFTCCGACDLIHAAYAPSAVGERRYGLRAAHFVFALHSGLRGPRPVGGRCARPRGGTYQGVLFYARDFRG